MTPFPAPAIPQPSQPTAPLSIQSQTQELPGTMLISMDAAGLGSNPISTIFRSTDPRIQVAACSPRCPVPGMIHQHGLPGILWPHRSPLPHHRCVQTRDKPCQSQLAKSARTGDRWGRETMLDPSPWASSSMFPGEAPPCFWAGSQRRRPPHPQGPESPSQWLLDLPSSFLAPAVPLKDEGRRQGLVQGQLP